jgi:preprotein translocase subunit SecG
MYQIIMVLHVIVALALIGLVLIQHGKGADIGAGLGTGASNTLFGSQGTGGFLFKLTGALALTFFLTSVLLSTLLASQYQAELPTLPAKVLPLALERPAPVDLKESK